jgi:hypothetical protein
MRIIISEKGAELMRSMSKEKVEKDDINRSLEFQKIQRTRMSNRYDPSLHSHTLDSLSKSSKIKVLDVKQKKVHIPKNISEKYNNDAEDGNGRLLPNVYLSLNTLNLSNSPRNHTISNNETYTDHTLNTVSQYSPKSFRIRELLKDNTMREMEKDVKQASAVRNRLSRVDEGNFRVPFRDPDYLKDIRTSIEKEVPIENINLIHYLSLKNNVSENFIKQLYSYDQERMKKVNKFCQILVHNQGKEHLLDNEIKTKIQGKNLKELEDYKKSLARMNNDLGVSNIILKNNTRFNDKKEKYFFIHGDIQSKYWDRYKIDNLHSPRRRPRIRNGNRKNSEFENISLATSTGR